jgi:hypothetical protein
MNEDDETPASRSLGKIGVLCVLIGLLCVLWWPGCRQYPELSNRDAIILHQALYSVCSSRDPSRIAPFEQKLAGAEGDGTLNPEQAAAFRNVLALAKSGDWDTAKAASYRFAEDQVR